MWNYLLYAIPFNVWRGWFPGDIWSMMWVADITLPAYSIMSSDVLIQRIQRCQSDTVDHTTLQCIYSLHTGTSRSRGNMVCLSTHLTSYSTYRLVIGDESCVWTVIGQLGVFDQWQLRSRLKSCRISSCIRYKRPCYIGMHGSGM